MARNRRKKPNKHYVERFMERYPNAKKEDAMRISHCASKNGYCIEDFKDCPRLYKYLLERSIEGKRIKIYNGFVFVMYMQSDAALTLYRIKGKYMDEYEAKIKILRERRKKKK